MVRHLRTDYRQANLSPHDRALLDYVAKMARHHHEATQEDIQRLRDAGFTDADILHVVYWIAGFNQANTITDCLGYEAHEHITAIFVDDDIADQVGDPDAVTNLSSGEVVRSGWEKAVVRALEGRRLTWLNSPPLNWQAVRGKVMVVMYWDAVHPNSLIGLPTLQRWYEQYTREGLVVLAPHTAEMKPAKDRAVVERVAERMGLTFPIILDSGFRQALGANNRFWPAVHLIDGDGYVRYRHHGPGGFEVIEGLMGQLLAAAKDIDGDTDVDLSPTLPVEDGASENPFLHPLATPELYAAYRSGEKLQGVAGPLNRTKTFVLPDTFEPDRLYIEGEWIVRADGLELAAGKGKCAFQYMAERVGVFISLGSRDPTTLCIRLDGQPYGATVTIEHSDFYWLAEHASVESHRMEIEVSGVGAQLHRVNFLPFRGTVDA